MIGTGPGEGADTREGWLEIERAGRASGTRIQGEKPRAWEEGGVGWAFDRPTFLLADGGRIICRLTAIFHQEDGAWKLVHGHLSVGVPDEQVTEYPDR